MRRILFVATLSIHFQCFYLPCFKLLKDDGWEVSSVCLDPVELPHCDKNYGVCIERLPYHAKNILAYKQLEEIITRNKFDVIHCNTPMGGVLARLASRKARKHGTKVIYTAHGFHFYKGSPYLGWLLYCPIEFILSKVTDCLITINDEDYSFAKKHLKAAEVVYVHGVGYDNEKFLKVSKEKRDELRRKNGYSDTDILLVYVAELNENKNQQVLIRAFKKIAENKPKARLLLIGPDRLGGRNQQFARDLDIEHKVDFPGIRTDVHELIPMCDLTVASSIREGLPVNIMESLACGVPVVATNNRGHRALIENGVNGYLTNLNNAEELAERVLEIIEDEETYRMLSENAVKSVVRFSKDYVLEEMKAVYEKTKNR